MPDKEKRRHERVQRPYTMKYFSKGEKEWNAVTPINMSESGICFFTADKYSVGEDIQFYISDPSEP